MLSACGDDPDSTATTADAAISTDAATADTVSGVAPQTSNASADTAPGDTGSGLTVPPGATIPAGALPSGVSIPDAVVDQMIAQFEQAGMKVDKACFTALLQDESLRKMVEAGGTPNQEAIQKFFTCLSA
jgi:hypothetical protein